MPTQQPPGDGDRAIAAIDVGTNSIRMAIAQVLPDGDVELLEHLQRAVRLGQDTFRRGSLSRRTMRAALSILRDYRRVLNAYNVQHVRAVATSAVREASNTDAFLDRVLMATGVDVTVMDTPEACRLIVTATLRDLSAVAKLTSKTTLIAEVGGGSTLLTVLEGGEIVSSQSVNLGSIRLSEVLNLTSESPERTAELLAQQISKTVAAVDSSLPLNRVRSFVAVGGDARLAAEHVGGPLGSSDLKTIKAEDFETFIDRVEQYTPEALTKQYGLSFAQAETLGPALLVYRELLRATKASSMIVSRATMRDGLLMDMARSVTGVEDETAVEGVIRSAITLAERYHIDVAHAAHVAELSVQLFDELKPEHGLSARHRLLLRAAGILHEVGGYVSSRAHHKHSYYLIVNSEVFGLTRDELQIVAHVARYHRRSAPKPSHLDYMTLPREHRMVVSKLAAILRVADVLDRGHAQSIRRFDSERQDEDFVITIRDTVDLTLERSRIGSKADLFEDIYGMRVRLEESPLTPIPDRRAEAVT